MGGSVDDRTCGNEGFVCYFDKVDLTYTVVLFLDLGRFIFA